MIETAKAARAELHKLANPEKAVFLQRFFRTGKGEYAEGDKLLGVVVPQTRRVAKLCLALPLPEIENLLSSPIHEERLLALIVMVENYRRSDDKIRKQIFKSYLGHRQYVNNWDLVDTSAPYIVGPELKGKNPPWLKKLARSKTLWDRRIAMLATFHLIREKQFKVPLEIATMLKDDEHDLIHKAVGWLLREIGKRDKAVELTFLKRHHKEMPRTMLRYAIEHFPKPERDRLMGRPARAT